MDARVESLVAEAERILIFTGAGIPLIPTERGAPYIIINRGDTEQDGQPAVSLRLEGDVIERFAGK